MLLLIWLMFTRFSQWQRGQGKMGLSPDREGCSKLKRMIEWGSFLVCRVPLIPQSTFALQVYTHTLMRWWLLQGATCPWTDPTTDLWDELLLLQRDTQIIFETNFKSLKRAYSKFTLEAFAGPRAVVQHVWFGRSQLLHQHQSGGNALVWDTCSKDFDEEVQQ